MTGEPFGAFAPSHEQARLIASTRRNPFTSRGKWRMKTALKIASLRPGPIDYESGGVKFRLWFDVNPIDWGIALRVNYEGPEMAFLADGLSPGSTFIDVGANIGLYGLTLAQKVGPTGKVVAVDPDPVASARLTENARLNAFPQFKVVVAAAGDREGEIGLSFDGNPAHTKVSESGAHKVRVRTLAGILAEHGVTTIDALKIDVEGFEDQVLRPFFETAHKQHWPRRVLIEDLFIDKSADNIVKHMKGLGYREAGRNRENAFLILD